MTKHPAAALLAQDLGRLQHTNPRGETGLIHYPGFPNGADPGAPGAGALAQALTEAIIETLEARHGYVVVHRSELGKAQPTDTATPTVTPPIPPRPQFISEQQRQTITEQLGDHPGTYNREQSMLLVTMLGANLMRLLNDNQKLPWVKAEMDADEEGFRLSVRIVAPGAE